MLEKLQVKLANDHGLLSQSTVISTKISVMEVLQECIKGYGIQSFLPYVNDIWTALRTEITNNVVTDVIEPAFIALKAFAKGMERIIAQAHFF